MAILRECTLVHVGSIRATEENRFHGCTERNLLQQVGSVMVTEENRSINVQEKNSFLGCTEKCTPPGWIYQGKRKEQVQGRVSIAPI